MAEIAPPHQFLINKINIPSKILMGPGPSNMPKRVRQVMSSQLLGHMHPETLKIMDDVKKGIKYLFQTNNLLTLCISASGHGGMEASLCNLIEDGDVILIAVCGLWGERASGMAQRMNAVVHQLRKVPGDRITVDEIREQFQLLRPKFFFMAHGESSTGQLHDLEGFGDLCRQFDCIFIVDSVITMGCVPLYVDKWKIDVCYSGSQKVLNAPPGITPITFNSRAVEKIRSRQTPVRSYYFDMLLLSKYWKCLPEDERFYHHTISPTLLYGLREAIAIFIEKGGLESSWKRHKKASHLLYKKLECNGFRMLLEDIECRVPSVTSVIVPQDINPVIVANYAMEKYKLEIAGGLGSLTGRIFRIGLLGDNATEVLVEKTVKILAESTNAARKQRKVEQHFSATAKL